MRSDAPRQLVLGLTLVTTLGGCFRSFERADGSTEARTTRDASDASTIVDGGDTRDATTAIDAAAADDAAILDECDPSTGWITSGVGVYGPAPSLVLDAAGAPHMGYIGNPGYPVRYLSRSGVDVTWDTEDVGAFSSWYPSSFGLDEHGDVHAVFDDATDGGLRYAHRDSMGAWTTDTVDDAHGHAFSPKLVIDRSGAVHVVYIDGESAALSYAHRSAAGEWSVSSIDGASAAVWGFAPALDPDERVHAVFCSTYDVVLQHAERDDDGGWTVTRIDELSYVPSLTIGADRTLHVAYTGTRPGGFELRYAHRDSSGAWEIEHVAEGLIGYSFISSSGIVVDDAGDAHIAFYGNGPSLSYAHRDSSGWRVGIIAPGAASDLPPSIAIDADGGIHIAYFDAPNLETRYAYRAPCRH